jgi:oxygen-independent coproporphyrinogen-3 oxidase
MVDAVRRSRHAESVRPVSVYVHFPWCLKKCPYCDFNSHATPREDVPHEAYADAVLAELRARDRVIGADAELVSVFFGGGTPSLWDARALGRVLGGVRDSFAHEAPGLEVTVECNPTSLDRERAIALREVGVNRLSIGVQSLDAARLSYLGRLHDPEGAVRALDAAVGVMPRVSADLMFGSPGQRADDFVSELERVLATGVRHVSAYALTIEPGTRFGELHRKGLLQIAKEDDYAESFERASEALGRAGFSHYEVSNHAMPGEEARHNQHYWRGGDHVGLGAGAYGCVRDEATRGARRWRSEPIPTRYLERSGRLEVEVFAETLSPDDVVREALMLGLRTREGVDLEALARRTGVDPLRDREAALARRTGRGELVREGDTLRVPREHWLALDAIVADVF